MYLFGGFNTTLMNDMMMLDVDAMHWSSVAPDSVALPSPRRCHTLCASSGDDGKRLWLFGGTDGQKTVPHPTHKSPSVPCLAVGTVIWDIASSSNPEPWWARAKAYLNLSPPRTTSDALVVFVHDDDANRVSSVSRESSR
jgi:hypothetical protein